MTADVVQFSDHARVSPAASSAKSSKVISTDKSAAMRDSGKQYAGGKPRERQQLTVDGCTPSRAATALVPPRREMTIDDGVSGADGVLMPPDIVCVLQTCQGFATRKTTFFDKDGPIIRMMDPPEIIGQRLEHLRVKLGFSTQTAFADALGISKSTYNLYKTGARPLTFETACTIRRKFGMSLDWLFFGDMRQGAIETMAEISAESEPTQPRRAKSAGK